MTRTPLLAAMGMEKYHVLNGEGSARCGHEIVPGTAIPARTVEPIFRCGSAPCRAKWPALLRAVS